MVFFSKNRWRSDLQMRALRTELGLVAQPGGEGMENSTAELHGPLDRLSQRTTRSFDDLGELLAFRADCEAFWGQPVTDLDSGRLRHGDLFAIHKAVAMARLGRTPADVTEGYCTASGSVDGVRLFPREIFWQRFKPIGQANGRFVLVSPRFGETGRDYYDAIRGMNYEGYDVVVMDHQWAGQSEGKAAEIDRGYGVARDVAAVTAWVASVQEREYGKVPGARVILAGKALGASAGVLGALTLSDAGLLKLDGRQMPEGLCGVLLSPWLGPTSSIENSVRKWASHLPLVERVAVDYGEHTTLRLDSPRALRGVLKTLEKAKPDIDTICRQIESGEVPKGRLYVIHGARDPFVDPEKSVWLTSQISQRATLRLVDARYAKTQSTPFMREYVLDGLNALVAQTIRFNDTSSE
jgi:acetyl esterase/lipase